MIFTSLPLMVKKRGEPQPASNVKNHNQNYGRLRREGADEGFSA
jgi:hypothetical protein